MTRTSKSPETQTSINPGPTIAPTSRERIDALLDEALAETFPASDSSAIASGIALIKREHREREESDRSTQ